MLKTFTAALLALPPETAEAARIDGANWWQLQLRVLVPQIKPIIEDMQGQVREILTPEQQQKFDAWKASHPLNGPPPGFGPPGGGPPWER